MSLIAKIYIDTDVYIMYRNVRVCLLQYWNSVSSVQSSYAYALHITTSLQFCTAVQNILVDRHCRCEDIFLCPHSGDRRYGVLISDFDSALRVKKGREKLQMASHPIKYRVHGTAGYRPPEVGEGTHKITACTAFHVFS